MNCHGLARMGQVLSRRWNIFGIAGLPARDDIVLVVCGSAASWMINKLINNKGGLHNRITKKMKIVPFTLRECEMLLQPKNSMLDRYQILQLYMVFGGIPFYWNEVSTGKSAFQNINDICFTEFTNLFRSLFNNYQSHEALINALAKKAKGLTREENIDLTGLPNAGSTTRIMNEFEESGFIRIYSHR